MWEKALFTSSANWNRGIWQLHSSASASYCLGSFCSIKNLPNLHWRRHLFITQSNRMKNVKSYVYACEKIYEHFAEMSVAFGSYQISLQKDPSNLRGPSGLVLHFHQFLLLPTLFLPLPQFLYFFFAIFDFFHNFLSIQWYKFERHCL